MTQRITRRSFLANAATVPAVAGVGYVSSRAAAQSKSANEKLNIMIIGCAGRGGHNMGQFKNSENIVGLCDIDEKNIARGTRSLGDQHKPTIYYDLRKAVEHKGLNAVIVSTTDHTHAPANVLAMRNGLHVYSEKPLAHTVREAHVVRQTYLERKDKIATQMGTQIHATDNYRRVVELVQHGTIGQITEAHVWCNRHSRQNPPPPIEGTKEAPSYLHWDLWVGPAPKRGYANGYHPGNLTWNRYWDIGNGILGDMGSHLIDLPYWALDLTHPTAVSSEAPKPHPVIYPSKLKVTWEHPKRGDKPHEGALKVVWYDGGSKPSNVLGVDVSKYGIGVLFVGTEGKLLADYGRRTVIKPDGSSQSGVSVPKPWIPKSRGHHAEWLHACKNDPSSTLCNFDYSGRLIEHNLLGTVAHRAGNKRLEYDAKQVKVTNDKLANIFVSKTYREGWGGIFD